MKYGGDKSAKRSGFDQRRPELNYKKVKGSGAIWILALTNHALKC
jgi:hypothetical protein